MSGSNRVQERRSYGNRTIPRWRQTKTREELMNTLGWGEPRKVTTKDLFSPHHPTIPMRYVPPWQTDMKNRKLIIQNCKLAGNPVWKGHVSYFLSGRERLSATSYELYDSVLNYSRLLHGKTSHLSKFNSSTMQYSLHT